ncbi:hypothetical protein [Paraglaciecola sp. 2405UD69-4]|uniref:hypothetical protein n=1 Tax=Paraglaciecola sp. 2405UD69-4 TaxID=3391836 RepID=UPI0039C9FB21
MQSNKMSNWKMQICAGNECFNKCQILSALAHYNNAVTQAEILLQDWFDPKAAVASVVISYHNLADLYLKENKPLLAEQMLTKVHQKIAMCLSDARPNSYRASALIWGVSQTYIALIHHHKNHPSQVITTPPDMPSMFATKFKNTLN